ncbi:MAG: hypothetical protein CBD39_00850 [Flavobacteriaceae bacterium TMED179]|nr:MAG: hypothetical protein CBD39_00850 [Flavobacteriaceae bacterium TMED179]
MKRNTVFLILIVLLSLSIGYLFGTQNDLNISAANSSHPSINKLNRLITYLTNDYVDKINADSLVREVIENIVDELDPHSIYIPAIQSESLSESMKGNFEGIGVQFRMLEDTIAVSRVLEGGPSKRAGLKSGDRILMADQDTLFSKGLKNEQVISRLKGNSSTPVRLTVFRKKQDSIYNFNIIRGPVPLPSINASYMIERNTGYIKINRFSQTTYSEFRKALIDLQLEELKNLIIDLRGNPGGYLLPAKQIADDFLEAKKAIVIVEGNNGKRERTVSSSEGLFESGRLYVLVDEDSASASEVIAGAIQDNDRGLIMGRRTFGKGLVQQQMPLGEGDQIRLTTARYYTPTGRSIQRPYDSSSRLEYYAEAKEREKINTIENKKNTLIENDLIFKTPKGRIVYGGGGITPDIYISNNDSPDAIWSQYLISSNLVDLFVFRELDKNYKKYDFSNAPRFFNEELPYKKEFIEAFKTFCKEFNLPIQINSENENEILNFIKAFIALQLFNENTHIRIINQTDPFILRALQEIKGH